MALSDEELKEMSIKLSRVAALMGNKVVVAADSLRLMAVIGLNQYADLERISDTLEGPVEALAELQPLVIELNELLCRLKEEQGPLPAELCLPLLH